MSYLLDTNIISELVRSRPNDAVLAWFADVAEEWGRLQANAERPVPAIDSLLTATALHHELRMVTRNARDFDYAGLETINPWLLWYFETSKSQ